MDEAFYTVGCAAVFLFSYGIALAIARRGINLWDVGVYAWCIAYAVLAHAALWDVLGSASALYDFLRSHLGDPAAGVIFVAGYLSLAGLITATLAARAWRSIALFLVIVAASVIAIVVTLAVDDVVSPVALGWNSVFLVALITVAIRHRRRRVPLGFCPDCRYDCTNLRADERCPECGSGAPRTTDPSAGLSPASRVLLSLYVIAVDVLYGIAPALALSWWIPEPAAMAIAVAVAAPIAWVALGAVLAVVRDTRARLGEWFDACLRTMAVGITVLLLGVFTWTIPVPGAVLIQAGILVVSAIIMTAMFLHAGWRLGITIRRAALLWFGVLFPVFAVVAYALATRLGFWWWFFGEGSLDWYS